MATGQKVVLRLEAYQVPVSAAKVSVIDGNQTIDYRMTSREDMWQAEISLPQRAVSLFSNVSFVIVCSTMKFISFLW